MSTVDRRPWVVLIVLMFLAPMGAMGQIFEPEGLNMPGTWDGFTNPPNVAALRSNTLSSGDIIKVTDREITLWQTVIEVAASGGDVVGGTYEWLFTSGPDIFEGNPGYFKNKWAGVTVSMNTKQTYIKESGTNNSITITNGMHYVMNWKDSGYTNTDAIFLELSEAPTTIETISDTDSVNDDESYTVDLTIADALATEEKVYVRYTTDEYATSFVVAATFDGTSGSAVIPAQTAGSTVQYYAFTTVGTAVESDLANADLYSIDISDGGEYTSVSADVPPTAIVLTAPANSASGVALRPTFTWEENVDATSYQLQVSTDDFATTVINATGLTEETFTATSNLRMVTTYSWRVRGVNGGGNGAWSDVRIFTTVLPTVSLQGNGGGGFGDVIGSSSLRITHDDTHLNFELTKGIGSFNDVLTLYIDSKTGGFASTSTLTDELDEHRKAATGHLSDITFPTGFTADYAITLDTDFAGLWVLSTGTLASATSLSAAVPLNTTALHTFRVAKSLIEFDSENTFSIIGTYGNAESGFRSNESFSIGLGHDNPGEADVTLRSFHNYPAGTITADVRFFGAQGWRFLANPFNALSLNDYLSPLWTQGFTGSDFPGAASSNVLTYNGSAWTSVANQSDNMHVGSGYAVGVYANDTFGETGGFPKTVTVTGTPTYVSVGAPLNGEDTYALIGNPFPFSVDFDAFDKTGMADIVYVYDYEPAGSAEGDVANAPGVYRAWNGTAGSLSGGHIAPFQGFLVYQDEAGATLNMELADRSSPAVFRGKEVERRSFEIVLKGNGLYSSAWVDISEAASLGLDSKDAFKLSTFDTQQARLYTVSGDVALDINHLPVSDLIEIPLGIESTKSGMMTLERGTWDIPADWSVYVRDSQTGSTRELKAGEGMEVEPTIVARKAATSNQIEMVSVTSPRYVLIVDPLNTTSTKDDGRGTMDEFTLLQNYPNPFNPSTQIRFTLQSSHVTRLTVYDILGREVAVLVNGTMSAGSHTVTFDASQLTSGVYLYKLEAGGETMIRRMTLIK